MPTSLSNTTSTISIPRRSSSFEIVSPKNEVPAVSSARRTVFSLLVIDTENFIYSTMETVHLSWERNFCSWEICLSLNLFKASNISEVGCCMSIVFLYKSILELSAIILLCAKIRIVSLTSKYFWFFLLLFVVFYK